MARATNALSRALVNLDASLRGEAFVDKTVEEWFSLFHGYAVVLNDPSYYRSFAQVLRSPHATAQDQTVADWAECLWIVAGTEDDFSQVARLCGQIQARNTYGQKVATRQQIESFLKEGSEGMALARNMYRGMKSFYERPSQETQKEGAMR